MNTVDALWVGPGGYDLPQHTRVDAKGNAVYSVPEGEAVASDHWQPLTPPAPVQTRPTPPTQPAKGEDD